MITVAGDPLATRDEARSSRLLPREPVADSRQRILPGCPGGSSAARPSATLAAIRSRRSAASTWSSPTRGRDAQHGRRLLARRECSEEPHGREASDRRASRGPAGRPSSQTGTPRPRRWRKVTDAASNANCASSAKRYTGTSAHAGGPGARRRDDDRRPDAVPRRREEDGDPGGPRRPRSRSKTAPPTSATATQSGTAPGGRTKSIGTEHELRRHGRAWPDLELDPRHDE